MSTEQSYVGGGNYATPANQSFSGHLYRTQVYLVVTDIARLSGESELTIWKRIYQLVHAYYGVYLPGLPRRKNESLLRVAERHDLLDKVYSVAYSERIKYQS